MRSCAVRALHLALATTKSCSGVQSFASAELAIGLPKLWTTLVPSDVSGAAACSWWHGRHYGGYSHGHIVGSEQLVPGECVTMHDSRRKSAMSGVVSYTSPESLAVDLLLARSEMPPPLVALLREAGIVLDSAQASLALAFQDAEADDFEGMRMDSVKRKRASKMNKHKHRKRRKRERMRK